MSNKYLEYNDSRLVFEESVHVEYVKLLSQIHDNLTEKTQIISLKNRILKLTWKNISSNFYIDSLKCSGIMGVSNKRLQIPPSKDSIKALPIGIYYNEKNSCYVLFDNLDLSTNNNSSNRSIWVDFNHILFCLKTGLNLKYKCKDNNENKIYSVYLSNNINLLLNRNFEDFREMNINEKTEIKNTILEFKNMKQLETSSDDEINNFIFKKEEVEIPKEKLIEIHMHQVDAEIGKLGEQLFNSLLIKDDALVLENLKIKKIDSFIWNNEHKESYLPYDFIINENIFIDIKATSGKTDYFVLTDNEYAFKQEKDRSQDYYFVINVTNVLDQNNLKWNFYDSFQIDEINCVKKTERIYGNKYGK